MRILFLEPIFKERIWGGNKIKQTYRYQTSNGLIGECWAISGHRHGSSKIKTKPYENYDLNTLFKTHRNELFNGDQSEDFPILIKILDAQDDLSIQVHPDNEYAYNHDHDLGKTECWYVIDAQNNTYIIDGHNAKTKKEFIEKVHQNDQTLWHKREIKKDDFIYIPAKKVHAIGKGAFIYEVQQSSDTTYRVYDYDRLQENGKKRDLHLDKAMEVIEIPDKHTHVTVEINAEQDYTIYQYIKNEFFDVKRIDVHNSVDLSVQTYQLCSVLEGSGFVNETQISKGDHFIICEIDSDVNISFAGKMKVMITSKHTKTS